MDRCDAAAIALAKRLLDVVATVQIDVAGLAVKVRCCSRRDATAAIDDAGQVLLALHVLADVLARCDGRADPAVPGMLRGAAEHLSQTGVADLAVVLLAAGQSPTDVHTVINALE